MYLISSNQTFPYLTIHQKSRAEESHAGHLDVDFLYQYHQMLFLDIHFLSDHA